MSVAAAKATDVMRVARGSSDLKEPAARPKPGRSGPAWVKGRSYAYSGGQDAAGQLTQISHAIKAQNTTWCSFSAVASNGPAEFEELEFDQPTIVTGVAVKVLKATQSAILQNCLNIERAEAGGDLLLERCSNVQSAGARGALTLIGTEVGKKRQPQMQHKASQTEPPPPPPPPAPVSKPRPVAPRKKERRCCTLHCAGTMLAALTTTAAVIWDLYYRIGVGSTEGVRS